MRIRLIAAGLGTLALLVSACAEDEPTATTSTTAPANASTTTTGGLPATGPVTFTVTIWNNPGDVPVATPLAPGLVLLHDAGAQPIFTPGLPAGDDGLEALAEDGDPTALAEAIGAETFQAEEGGYEAGPLLPGDKLVLELTAEPGQHLSLAAMFGESNDWFFATMPEGIALFDEDGVPINGDVNDQIALWDAGTEVDQPIGEGVDQAPRQVAPGSGQRDGNDKVRRVDDAGVGSALDYIRVTITPSS